MHMQFYYVQVSASSCLVYCSREFGAFFSYLWWTSLRSNDVNSVGEGLGGGYVFQKPSHDDVSNNLIILYYSVLKMMPIFVVRCFHGLMVCSVVAYAWGNMERKREL